MQIQPSAAYLLLNIDDNCNARNHDQPTCAMFCRWRHIRRVCHCNLMHTPVFDQGDSDQDTADDRIDYPQCTLAALSECQGWSTAEMQSCAKHCHTACAHTTYTRDYLRNSTIGDASLGRRRVRITATFVANKYIVFTQLRTFTWDIIVATLGGALQFWVGAGVVTFVHWLLFAQEQLRRVLMAGGRRMHAAVVQQHVRQRMADWAVWSSKGGVEMKPATNNV